MVQQLWADIEKMKSEIRRLRGEVRQIASGGIIIPTSIISSGGGGGGGSTSSFVRWLNDSGLTHVEGTVVSHQQTGQDFSYAANTIDSNIIGVLMEDTINGAYGSVRHLGYQDVVKVDSAVTAGNYLQHSVVNQGFAVDSGVVSGNPAPTGSFAIALSNFTPSSASPTGTVSAYVFPVMQDRDFFYLKSTFQEIDFVNFLIGEDFTIAGGIINVGVALPHSNVRVDTEAAAGTDDLDTVSGGFDGAILILHPVSDARTIVIKHNTGNILCMGNADITLDDAHDYVIAVYDDALNMWMVK